MCGAAGNASSPFRSAADGYLINPTAVEARTEVTTELLAQVRFIVSFTDDTGEDQLRATTSLSHLLQEQGRRDEARIKLNEIHSWFTEGFDIADLKDARALLDPLAQSD